MKKNYFFKLFTSILFLTGIGNQNSFAQVGVGTTTPTAALDVTSTNDGILVPRVALTITTSALPLTAPTTSEMVYNTATVNDVTPGFYYWDGTKWVRIISGTNNDWTTTGNSGTTAGTNFIGTTDAIDLRIKTAATDRWNISNANSGQLQSYSLGTAALPTYSWQGDQNTGIFSSGADNLDFTTGGTARFRVPNADQVHALSLGTAALPFYSFSTDTNTGIFSPTADNLAFSTNGVEGMRMRNTSNVTIGATFSSANAAPANGLRVQGQTVINKASGEDTRDFFSAHTSATSYGNITGYPNPAASRAVAGYADGNGMGIFGFANRTGYGVVGLTQANTLSSFIQTGEGILGQSDGATGGPNIPIGTHGIIHETAAGNWRASGVVGENNNVTPGIAFSSGPYTANGVTCGTYGNYAAISLAAGTNQFAFGVAGDLLALGGGSIPDGSGGVFGVGGSSQFGMLGYRALNGTLFSVYGGGANGSINAGNTGRVQTETPNNHIGLGIYGGFMGGIIKGENYGTISKGKEFGMYVDGNTVTNSPIMQLNTNENDSKRTITYTATSTSVDITTRGTGELKNGSTFVAFKEAFKNSISMSEPINITVTPTSETNGVYVTGITNEGFYVKENQKGKSNASFNWVAIGTKSGFEKGVEISEVVLNKDFDKKIDNVLISSEQPVEEKSMYYDGTKIVFERIPEQYIKSTQKSPK
ncbi:MAG: hypothetical protein QM535_07005 [Limnohabitans sp.]|nr:hypothetical protein [Limnohabitans sp.]